MTDREREVFTRFVLGGVAEELRRRVNQAGQLVEAMNTSLKGIRTSNGIGVRLGWGLREEHAALGRVLDLVATSDAVRSEAQNAELTELLRHRVEEFHAADPSSGYAAHLNAALDYRHWHEVGVIILGPAQGQERRLSRRAKLSQGETRFVSYVTLFAAVDAYLTGLADDGRALRLILLDDAFAKVDERTVGELMGLLVRLDIDFAMTGHALWGCFPQVPGLDVYEVRRRDGTSAVTTHVHWDGRTRHLRSTMSALPPDCGPTLSAPSTAAACGSAAGPARAQRARDAGQVTVPLDDAALTGSAACSADPCALGRRVKLPSWTTRCVESRPRGARHRTWPS